MTDTLFVLRYYTRRYPNEHQLLRDFKYGRTRSFHNAIYTMAAEAYRIFEDTYTNSFLIRVATIYLEQKREEFNSIS